MFVRMVRRTVAAAPGAAAAVVRLKLDDGDTGGSYRDGGANGDCTGCGGADCRCLVVNLDRRTDSNWTDSI